MTDDDIAELVQEILTELKYLRRAQERQAKELAEIKAGIQRIERDID
jgi:hypothetical protein